MLKTWIERLIGKNTEAEVEEITLTRLIVRPVRVEQPWTRTIPAAGSGRVPAREIGPTMPSGPRLEGSRLEAPPPSAVPADLLLMNELAAAEREAAELADLERWIAEEDVRSERLRAEEAAVLGLLKRSG
jgi:hypothetical protein